LALADTDEVNSPLAKRQCVDTASAVAVRDFEQQVVAIQSVVRLFESYGSHFTRKIDLYPSIRAIFASPKGVEELAKHGDSVVISSDLITLGLSLIIFSVLADGEEQAVVWLISNARDVENYEGMVRYIDEITEGKFNPANVVISAEDLNFREAFSRVYPQCKFLLSKPTTPHHTNSSAVPLADPQLMPSQLTSFSTHSVIASTILSSLEPPPST